MNTPHEKNVLIETIKATGTTRSFTWMDWTNYKQEQLHNFKLALEPDWDSNSEKVYKKREEELKKTLKLVEEFIKFKFPEDTNVWKHEFDVSIMITKK